MQAGTHELFTVLPGAPDGIALAPDGGFWVAIYMKPLATSLYTCDCTGNNLRALLESFPPGALPIAPRVGMVAKLSSEGKVCIEGPCTTALRSRGAERGASCAAGVGTAGAAFPTGRERDHREQLHLRR